MTTVGLPPTIPPGHVTIPPRHVTIIPPMSVEGQLHHACQVKRIRVSEFFKDYDPLRSGYITCEQFRRCLDQYLSLKLSEDDFSNLCNKYTNSTNGLINYRAFTAQLENAFDPDILDGKPQEQIVAFQSTVVGTGLTETQSSTHNILQKCQEYYEYRGINVKSCYADFDWHHRGYVTQTQFERSFPGPPDISSTDITGLALHYADPNTGLCNYLLFHHDIERLASNKGVTTQPTQPVNTTTTANMTGSSGVEEILQRLKDAVYKNGIRTTEFFIDHDKLRSGLITANQFMCGLSICCGSAIQLSRNEIQRLVEYYSIGDGRVCYREFCHLMENAYTVPDLEKKPTVDVYRPLRGHLTMPLPALSLAYDEERLAALLARLTSEVANKRLLLYPYFKDFDKGNGYSRGVTKSHFERVIKFAALEVSQDEMKLLITKFAASNGTDVNYAAFVQAIDSDFTGQTQQSLPTAIETSNHITPIEDVDVDELVARIREYIVTNRIRVSEHFEDFDPLRSGSISISRFRQGLSSLGLPYLTDAQLKALSSHYAHHTEGVDWRTFTSHVDPVLGRHEQPPLCRAGTTQVSSSQDQELLDSVMSRLRDKADQRRVLAKPCFQDFDRHHIGYVTLSQFRQCLSYLDLAASEAELKVMEVKYSDSKGFHYLTFLEHLSPNQPMVDKYSSRMTHLRSRKVKTPHDTCSVEDILKAIKMQVCKRRLCVLDFMKDYDKLRSGRILKTSFRRALDLCGFELTESQTTVLEQRYQSSQDSVCVDYTQFSDEIESIFATKGLEKMPTAQVTQFSVPVELNQVSSSEELVLQEALRKLAQRVRVRRIQLTPLFSDYDKVHNGSVTQSQFSRVLKDLELDSLVNALELRLLYRKFDVKVGGWSNVHYIDFCAVCENYPH